MVKNKELLLTLYEEAKRKRIVLNQSEFAKAVGKSRVHLFNKMTEIPDEIIEKAQKLLETKDVKKETEPAKFLVNHDLNKFLGERIELGAAREAAIRVLVIWMKEVYAEVFKRPFVEVSLEFDRLAANELMQILDQLRQQQ